MVRINGIVWENSAWPMLGEANGTGWIDGHAEKQWLSGGGQYSQVDYTDSRWGGAGEMMYGYINLVGGRPYSFRYTNNTTTRLSAGGAISNPQMGCPFWAWSVQEPGKVMDGLGGWSGVAAGWIPNGKVCLRLSGGVYNKASSGYQRGCTAVMTCVRHHGGRDDDNVVSVYYLINFYNGQYPRLS